MSCRPSSQTRSRPGMDRPAQNLAGQQTAFQAGARLPDGYLRHDRLHKCGGGAVAATRGPHGVPDTRLVRPRLSDDQLAILRRYGTVEPTTVGQVLFAAGDPGYDLIVLLEGRVEVSVVREGRPWPIAAAGPRDFLAELNLLTGQRVCSAGVVTE